MILNNIRKVVFLVLDLTWQIFSQTGNIEAYLLLKELEKSPIEIENNQNDHDSTIITID